MSSELDTIRDDDNQFLFQNYGERLPVAFTRGEKALLFDQDNREYVDFFSGIAVSNLGYNDPDFTTALHAQVDSLIHSSNWFLNREQNEAARLISELTFPGKTLFLNSGTEANEAAIKLARRYGLAQSEEKFRIFSFKGSFHGRTLGSMTATGQEKVYAGFGPLPEGFTHLPFNDEKALQEISATGDTAAALFIELIQGEGGIRIADKGFVQELKALCDEKDILFVADEIQTGAGRTGKAFAYQHFDITPDIITMAKGLAGGIPIGALHARDTVAAHFTPGSHGTTFGGNHLACAGATVVLKKLQEKNFLTGVEERGAYIMESLKKMRKTYSTIKDVRGVGMHIGFEVDLPCMDIVRRSLEAGLVLNCTAGSVLRIMPPLIIDTETIDRGLELLEATLKTLSNKG